MVETLIRTGDGLMQTKAKQLTDEQRGVETRRETPTLLSVGRGLRGHHPPPKTLSEMASSSVPRNTDKPGKFKASPQGGELFAFWHNFKLCTKGPILSLVTWVKKQNDAPKR